jgi:hypothetical protein
MVLKTDRNQGMFIYRPCRGLGAVTRRPLTAEVRVRDQVNPCGIFGGQSGTVTGFSPSSSAFPLSISFHRRSPNSYISGDEQSVR